MITIVLIAGLAAVLACYLDECRDRREAERRADHLQAQLDAERRRWIIREDAMRIARFSRDRKEDDAMTAVKITDLAPLRPTLHLVQRGPNDNPGNRVEPPRVEWVTHDAPIEPATCECGEGNECPECGRRNGERDPNVWHGCTYCKDEDCLDCEGTGKVPAVVTLVVECVLCASGYEPENRCSPIPVATATVAECLPMHAPLDDVSVDHLTVKHNGAVHLWRLTSTGRAKSVEVVTDRIVGEVAPGRYALRLTNIVEVK